MEMNDGSINSNVFLGGPFQHVIGTGKECESVFRRRFEEIYRILSQEFTICSAHHAEEYGKVTPQLSPEQIVTRDHGWMMICDLYVAVIPSDEGGNPLRSDGTCIEIGWASALRKPIVLLADVIPLTPTNSSMVRGLHSVANVHTYEIQFALGEPVSFLQRLKAIIANSHDKLINIENRKKSWPSKCEEL